MSLRRTVLAFAARQVSPSAMARHVAVGFFLVGFMLFFARFLCGQVLPIDPSCSPDRWRWDSSCDPMIWRVPALTDLFAVVALTVGLFFVVPAMIAAQLGAERRSGTLEQLRSSPASATALVGGFVLGAPMRVYLMLLGPLAYHVTYGLLGGLSLHALLGSVLVLGLGSVGLSTLGVAAALGPRKSDVSAMQPLALATTLGFSGLIALGLSSTFESGPTGLALIHPLGALGATLFGDDNIFRHVFAASAAYNHGGEPAVAAKQAMTPIFFALFMVPFALIIGAAALRRLRDPELPFFGKPLGIALFVVVLGAIVLPFAGLRDTTRNEGIYYLCAYGGVLLPLVLILAQLMTPTAERWAIGLRQAGSLFGDARGPFTAVLVMLLIFVTVISTTFGLGGPAIAGVGAAWGLFLALTAPIFFLYRSTHHAGGLFLFGYSVYLMLELTGMGMLDAMSRGTHPLASAIGWTAVAIGLAVPAWLSFRQRQLRSKLLAD